MGWRIERNCRALRYRKSGGERPIRLAKRETGSYKDLSLYGLLHRYAMEKDIESALTRSRSRLRPSASS